MKSVMMKWLHFDYNGRGFGICVSVVVSHEPSLNHSGGLNLLAKVSNNSPIPSDKLVARFSKLCFQRFFYVFPEKFFMLRLAEACLFPMAGFLWGCDCCHSSDSHTKRYPPHPPLSVSEAAFWEASLDLWPFGYGF